MERVVCRCTAPSTTEANMPAVVPSSVDTREAGEMVECYYDYRGVCKEDGMMNMVIGVSNWY